MQSTTGHCRQRVYRLPRQKNESAHEIALFASSACAICGLDSRGSTDATALSLGGHAARGLHPSFNAFASKSRSVRPTQRLWRLGCGNETGERSSVQYRPIGSVFRSRRLFINSAGWPDGGHPASTVCRPRSRRPPLRAPSGSSWARLVATSSLGSVRGSNPSIRRNRPRCIRPGRHNRALNRGYTSRRNTHRRRYSCSCRRMEPYLQ